MSYSSVAVGVKCLSMEFLTSAKYLCSFFSEDKNQLGDKKYRVGDHLKTSGLDVERQLFEGLEVPTVMYKVFFLKYMKDENEQDFDIFWKPMNGLVNEFKANINNCIT